jgi:hypothetical protein
MKIVLLKGQSQYGVLCRQIDELAKAFTARGDAVAVIDMPQMTSQDRFVETLQAQRPVDLVFSINILGEFADGEGRRISDLTGAPHVILFVDFPLAHITRLEHTPSTAAILTLDESHIRTINDYFGAGRFAYVGFCPLGGMGEPQPLPETADAFLASRPIPIFCPMTYYDPGEPPWRDYPEPIRTIFYDAAEAALAAEWLPALEALDRRLVAQGLDLADPQMRRDIAMVRVQANAINEWVRNTRRQRFFEAAAAVGLPLHVDGKGFDAMPAHYTNVVHLGCGDTNLTQQQMAKSRMVLNHNSNFGEGLHDRVPTAMLAGAAVASDTSQYYRDRYTPDEIALFRWLHLEEDLAAVKALLEDGDRLFAMAKAGQHKALQQDCWDHRIDAILTAAGREGRT